MSSISSISSFEILERIFEYANANGDGPAISKTSRTFYSVMSSLTQHYALCIYQNILKNGQNYSHQLLNDKNYRFENLSSDYQACHFLFQKIYADAKSINIDCKPRILAPEKANELISQINDRALELIWPKLSYQIKNANPGLNLDKSLKADAIREWLNNNPTLIQRVVSIDLSRENLQMIPSEIGLFTSLQTLNLYGNKLKVLTPEIAKLKSLKHLNLANNKLESIPKELGQLKSLKLLLLSNNHLQSLPSEIGELKALETIELSNNDFEEFPIELTNIASLRVCELKNNKLKSLPPEISSLENLRTLDLSENLFSTFPIELTTLKLLTSLYFAKNQVKTIPNEIGLLKSLQKLNLSANHLDSLTPEINTLVNLVEFNISDNQISLLPAEIAQLLTLEKLDLSNNQFKEFPKHCCLPRLRVLYIQCNQLQELPPEIEKLSQLEELNISENHLTALHPNISQLQALNKLIASNNHLMAISSDIKLLINLSSLDLSNNAIKTLPLETIQLVNLTELKMTNNPLDLTQIPVEIFSFTQFQSISLFQLYSLCLNHPYNREQIKQEFLQLSLALKSFASSIYKLAWEDLGKPGDFKEWCKHHDFDDIDVLKTLIVKSLINTLKTFPQKDSVYRVANIFKGRSDSSKELSFDPLMEPLFLIAAYDLVRNKIIKL